MTILFSDKAGKIIFFKCSLLEAAKQRNSEYESSLFTLPWTKIFLICSPKSVPPGSLVVICGIFFSVKNFDKKLICVDLPDPSPPSKVMNIPFSIVFFERRFLIYISTKNQIINSRFYLINWT